MEMNFCRRCGARLTLQSAGVYRCVNNHTLFSNSAPCVGIFFLTEDNHVLLSVRGIEPFKGMLDSIGGFVDTGETFEEAAAREITEETGINSSQYGDLNFISTETGIYPYEGENRDILGVFYWTRLRPNVILKPNDDVSEIASCPLDAIDLSRLDNVDVGKALRKLQKIVL